VPESQDHTANVASLELTELFAELVDASASIVELDRSQQDGWASGVLASWRSEMCDAEAVASADDAPGAEVAKVLGAAVRRLIDADGANGCEVTGCWLVESVDSGSSASAVIGFAHSDESEHCLLAEIDDSGALIDLHVGPSAADVLPDEASLEEMGVEFRIHEGDPAQTVGAIRDAWQLTANLAEMVPTESMLLNQALARARLRAIDPTFDAAELAMPAADEIDLHMGMSEQEVAEANARSVETLHRALERLRGQPAPHESAASLVETAGEPLRAGPRSLSHPEREALAFLEWADWLGVALGLGRAGPNVALNGDAMVDWINRCPEVTSSISRKDRPFVAYALNVAVIWWTDLGLVEDGMVNTLGFWVIPRAISTAWGGHFDQ